MPQPERANVKIEKITRTTEVPAPVTTDPSQAQGEVTTDPTQVTSTGQVTETTTVTGDASGER